MCFVCALCLLALCFPSVSRLRAPREPRFQAPEPARAGFGLVLPVSMFFVFRRGEVVIEKIVYLIAAVLFLPKARAHERLGDLERLIAMRKILDDRGR